MLPHQEGLVFSFWGSLGVVVGFAGFAISYYRIIGVSTTGLAESMGLTI